MSEGSNAAPQEQVYPCYKLVDQRRFDRIEQVLKSLATGGIIIAVICMVIGFTIVINMSDLTPPGVGMSAALAMLGVLLGLTTWTGSLRVKELIQAAGEIDANTDGLARALSEASKSVEALDKRRAAEPKKDK
jgi:hypothetical protein